MVRRNISKEEIDSTFAKRFYDTFERIIEDRRIWNSQLSVNGKSIGRKWECSHKALAAEAGVNEKTFHSYISNQNRSKRLDIVAKIAHHFNISVDYLLGFTDVRELYFDDVSTADIRKISEYTGLSSKAIEQLHKYAGLKNLTMTQTFNQLLEELADSHSIKEFDELHPLDEEDLEYMQRMAEEGQPEPPDWTEEELERSYQEYEEQMKNGLAAAMISESCKVFTGEQILQLIDTYLHLSMKPTEVYSVTNDGMICDANGVMEKRLYNEDIQMRMCGSEVVEEFLLEQIRKAIEKMKHGEPKWRFLH